MESLCRLSVFSLLVSALLGCSEKNEATFKETSSPDTKISVLENEKTLDKTDVMKAVLNHRGKIVKKNFNGYSIEIVSQKSLNDSEKISTSTSAVYGIIGGKNTKALLKINSNYTGADNIMVNVYKNSKLIGKSPAKLVPEKKGIFYFGKID